MSACAFIKRLATERKCDAEAPARLRGWGAAPGMLTKVGFWSQTDGPNIKIGIYTANGAQPGTLIAQAGPVAVVHGMTEVTLASPVQLAAGTYWYEAIGNPWCWRCL